MGPGLCPRAGRWALSDSQRLQAGQLPQCLCWDPTELVALQHPEGEREICESHPGMRAVGEGLLLQNSPPSPFQGSEFKVWSPDLLGVGLEDMAG